jgi:pimeloyl-ACP methyl ester carboxylesterase
MITEALNQTITLADGRVLGYAEAGDPEGKVLFHFHGLNSSRLEVKMVHEQMLKAKIRFIGIDRPGIGLSTFQENRKVLDIVEELEELADSLGIEKFSVLGISSGAKYVLACAYTIPHRLISCNVISSAAPMEFIDDDMDKEIRIFISFIQKVPWLIRPIYWLLYARLSQNISKSDQFLENIFATLGEVDKKLLKEETVKKMLLEAFRESYIQGSNGVAYDASFDLIKHSWGFKLEDIKFPNIHFWHGALDKGIPLSMVKSMIEKISGATLKVYPHDGHISIVINQIEEIIGEIDV